jgi:hypothetical protein
MEKRGERLTQQARKALLAREPSEIATVLIEAVSAVMALESYLGLLESIAAEEPPEPMRRTHDSRPAQNPASTSDRPR